MTKNVRCFSIFIFYRRAAVKQEHLMTHLLSYANIDV
jgi:hypothetical protein